MSNRHQMLKDARKAGSAHTENDQLRKFVARPKTVDHNMHDDYVHHPPKNTAEGDTWPNTSPKWLVQSAVPEQELGRIKRSDLEGELVEENSVHP